MTGVIVTEHACRQWIARIDPGATLDDARRAIRRLLTDARHDRDLDGAVQYRAARRSWPGRVRIRIGPHPVGLAVLTIMPEHDGWEPRPRPTACRDCSARLEVGIRCDACQTRHRALSRGLRAARIGRGQCVTCGQRAARGRTLCARHLAYYAARQKR